MKSFIKEIKFKEYEKDNYINALNVLTNTMKLIPDDLVAATALSILILNNKNDLAESLIKHSDGILTDELIYGVNAAVNIMNMNNVYYRGKHLLGADYSNIQPQLKMNIYSKHGIDKKYFEFISLAVSFINNCEFCIKSHSNLLKKEGMRTDQIHEALRIAAIFNTL